MAVFEKIVTGAEISGKSAVETTKKIFEIAKDMSDTEIKEVKNKDIKNIELVEDSVLYKLEDIKNLTPEQLREKMKKYLEKDDIFSEDNSELADSDENASEGLTNEEKAKIQEETGWSDEIIDAISSMEEYEIYKNAGLQEAEIGGKKCLVRNDIDWNQKDAMGRTNRERAEQGLSPINKDGKVIELHHIGQHADSPLAELTPEEHRGKGNDNILHDKTKESEIDRQAFAEERSEHWEARANERGE